MADAAPSSGSRSRVVRTIHHMACSGGTLVSKALAAQPGVVLLSEISPRLHTTMRFAPFDPEEQFLINYVKPRRVAVPGQSLATLTRRILAQRVINVLDICEAQGLILVVRDHSHSDYALDLRRSNSTLLRALKEAGIATRSIATLRDPVDAWASIRANGWEFKLDGLDRFCTRTARMLSRFPDDRIFRYEDFCDAPEAETRAMCAALALPFDPAFRDRMARITLTGDSGRKNSHEIARRPRRPLSPDLEREIAQSDVYRAFMASHYR